MVLHVRSKYTAVGRKEILVFFYLYFVVELIAIFLDSSIIPTSSSVYPVSRSLLSSIKLIAGLIKEGAELTVLCGDSFGISLCGVLGFVSEWVRRIPSGRRWNFRLPLGKLPFPSIPPSPLLPSELTVSIVF